VYDGYRFKNFRKRFFNFVLFLVQDCETTVVLDQLCFNSILYGNVTKNRTVGYTSDSTILLLLKKVNFISLYLKLQMCLPQENSEGVQSKWSFRGLVSYSI